VAFEPFATKEKVATIALKVNGGGRDRGRERGGGAGWKEENY